MGNLLDSLEDRYDEGKDPGNTEDWTEEKDEWEAILALMDNDLRVDTQELLGPCDEDQFLEAYEAAHEIKFGTKFKY